MYSKYADKHGFNLVFSKMLNGIDCRKSKSKLYKFGVYIELIIEYVINCMYLSSRKSLKEMKNIASKYKVKGTLNKSPLDRC